MSTDETAVDPTAALNGAGQLSAAGEAMLRKWVGLRADIEALHGKAPWGGDEVGTKFHEGYLGGATPAADNLLDVGESLITAIASAGTQVTEGVKGVVDLDDLIAQWFDKK